MKPSTLNRFLAIYLIAWFSVSCKKDMQADSFDENNALLKSGRMKIDITPDPFARFRQELLLQNGHVLISGQDGDHRLKARLWVETGRPLIHLEIESNTKVAVKAEYQNWRMEKTPIQSRWVVPSYIDYPGEDVYWFPDTLKTKDDHVIFYHQNNNDQADPSDPAWQVGRNYNLVRYQMACNASGEYPSKFKGGLFTFDPVLIDERFKADNPDQKKDHPRLILTMGNLPGYRIRSGGTHERLFEMTLALADEFSARSIPLFQNANNTYREIGDALPALGLAYQLTGKTAFAEKAKTWIQALLDTKSWEGSQNLGRSSWVIGLALTYDWIYPEMGDELKKDLINRLIKETEIIISTASSTRALSNHLLIETSAVGIVGLVLDERAGEKEVFLAQADQWTRYIIDHAPLDGSWGEGIQYWQYGTGYFLRFLESAMSSGYKDYFKKYNWLEKTGYFPIYFSLPDRLSRVINFSDCGTDRYLPAFLLYHPAGKYDNGHFQDFGEKIQADTPHKLSWLDFLFYDASVTPVEFTSLPLYKHFKDHGFLTMRSGWDKGSTLVGFRCGPAPGHRNQVHPERLDFRGFGPGHQQPDINNFCIFSQDEWLVIDPGYTKLKETRNHNTLLVNGHGQAGAGGKWLDYMEFESRDPVPEIIYTNSNETYDYLIGDAGNIYVDEAHLIHFRRHLVFIKPDLVIVLDDVLAKGQSNFECLFQLNEIAEADLKEDRIEVTKNQVRFHIFPVLPQDRVVSIQKRTLKANDVHGLPEHKEGILKTVNLSKKAEGERFLTVIGIQDKKVSDPPEVHYEPNNLIIQINGKRWTLEFKSETAAPDEPLLRLLK